MKTKLIIGLSVAAVVIIGTGIFIGFQISTGKYNERIKSAESKAKEHERREKEAIARADSLQQLHLKSLAIANRQTVFADSVIQSLNKFGNRIVLIREYENDSIVGSLDLSRQLKLFTEWRNAAEDGNAN